MKNSKNKTQKKKNHGLNVIQVFNSFKNGKITLEDARAMLTKDRKKQAVEQFAKAIFG